MSGEVFYPTDENGLALPPYEIDLPESRIPTELLGEGEPYVNNHHRYYIARLYGKTILTATFRQLEHHVDPLPVDVHRNLHQRYKGVPIPPDDIMLETIEQALEDGRMMYQGTSTRKLIPITDDRMRRVKRDYTERQRYGR